MLVDGCPASAGGYDEEALSDERPDDRHFADADRSRAADDPPEIPISVRFDFVAFRFDFLRALRRQRTPDEFRRISKRWVLRVDFDLRDDRRDASGAPGLSQRVLERLLDHVADPPGGRGDEHTEWKRSCLLSRDLVSHELFADLRTVAMHDADAPPRKGELHDWAEARTCVAELIVNSGPFAG